MAAATEDVSAGVVLTEIKTRVGSCKVTPKTQPFSRTGIANRKLRLCAGRSKMQITPQITFEGSESFDAARDVITREIARLETHNKRITGCRVTVIAPSHKHRHGTGFQVHIWLTIPSYENIVVNNSASDDARHEHAEVAIKDAFAAARRQVDALAA
jgi:ribosome-associated translation inhibitor RaiA